MRNLYTPHNTYQSPPNPDRCRHQVHQKGRGVGFYQCQKPAKYPIAGDESKLPEDHLGVILVCEVHHPIRDAERRAERKAKWSKERRIKADRWDRIHEMSRVCEGVNTERLKKLEKGALRKLLESISR